MQAGETRALRRQFTYQLNALSKLNDVASQALYAEVDGLALAQARCLAAIGSFPAISVKQLAFEANLDKSQVSRAAQDLVGLGLVLRQECRDDARRVLLSLTEAGRERFAELMARIERRNQLLAACLSPSERELLLDLLGRMYEHAAAARAGCPDPGE